MAATSNRQVVQPPSQSASSLASLVIPSWNAPLQVPTSNLSAAPSAHISTATPGNLPFFIYVVITAYVAKILKALQKIEFVELNSLLPTSLYVAVTLPNSFNVKFNPSKTGESVVAVTSPTPNRQKIQQCRDLAAGLQHFLSGVWFNLPRS